MATREEIKEAVNFCVSAFPNTGAMLARSGQNITNMLDAFTVLLSDIDSETLVIATHAACAELGREYAPSAAEIRKAMVELQKQAANVPTGAEAWEMVCEYINAVHSQRKELQPLVLKTFNAVGGERQIGRSENSDVMRGQFMKAYEQIKQRAETEAGMLQETRLFIEQNKLLIECNRIDQETSGLALRLKSPAQKG